MATKKQLEALMKRNYRHGMRYTRIYHVWLSMKDRCNNPRSSKYKYYGARGIKVCDKWKSFEGFYEDMKYGYEEHLEIDRIDNNGDYNARNCRWATRKQQVNNSRHNVYLEYKDKTYTMSQLSEVFGLKYNTFKRRIYRGWDCDGEIKRVEPVVVS